MNYNKLTPEEERVIVDKATELLSVGSMTIFMKMEHLSVKDVIHLSFHRKASLMPDVDGQALMIAFQMQ
jgi:hypothetical protein